MDRKWIVLVALTALTLAMGCTNNPPPPPAPPPAVAPTAPSTDVKPAPKPAPMVDETPKEVPKSIQELQQEANERGLLGDVYYAFDKYNLSTEARDRLAKNAEYMKANGGFTFTVEGHCDERGTNEYNLALGQNRSNSAVDYLVSLGVSAGRFKTISYGEEKPFCRESTEGCWQKNRRARFVLDGTGG